MHIVHVANYYAPHSGGMRTTMHALGRGYRAAGHRFTMIVPGTGTGTSREETPFGTLVTVPGIPLGVTGYSIVPTERRVRRVLEDLGPDRLEVSDRTTLRKLGLWARREGIPAVLFAHERIDDWIRQFTSVGARRPSAGARRAGTGSTMIADRMNLASLGAYERVVCTTAYAAAQFERLIPGSVVRVPLGVDTADFGPEHRSEALRAELLGSNRLLLVHAGRLSPEKAPGLSVQTLRELRSRGVDACLVIAGDGQSRAKLEREADGLPVIFTGFLSERAELATLLASADISLNPGPIETFCLSAVESLASGTPVVAANSSALPEFVRGDAGATADGNPIAFADAVQRVAARPLDERTAGALAVGRSFPWSRTVQLMLELHDSLGSKAAA